MRISSTYLTLFLASFAAAAPLTRRTNVGAKVGANADVDVNVAGIGAGIHLDALVGANLNLNLCGITQGLIHALAPLLAQLKLDASVEGVKQLIAKIVVSLGAEVSINDLKLGVDIKALIDILLKEVVDVTVDITKCLPAVAILIARIPCILTSLH